MLTLSHELNIKKNFYIKSFGISMLSFLQPNDVIYYKKINYGVIKINDIIFFKKEGKFLTHRVIYRANNCFITKGDNNLRSDGKIYPHQIIGKAYHVKRNRKIFNPEDVYLLQLTPTVFSTRLIDFS